MRSLVVIRRWGNGVGKPGGNGKLGLDSTCVPGVQGSQTLRGLQKLLCGA